MKRQKDRRTEGKLSKGQIKDDDSERMKTNGLYLTVAINYGVAKGLVNEKQNYWKTFISRIEM